MKQPKVQKGDRVKVNGFVGTASSVQWWWMDDTYAIELITDSGEYYYLKWIPADKVEKLK